MPVSVRPALEFNWRMGEMLHELHYHRPFAVLDIEQTFDAEQVWTAQLHQGIHRPREDGPGYRIVLRQHKAADTVAVYGFGDERIALIGGWVGQTAGIER